MILGMSYEAFILRIPVILLALTIHEVAHGWAALKLGDPTARDEGRLTLNPFSHLDPLGGIMLMTGVFGWAKPVPVNGYNLTNIKRDLLLVSLAGPVSNIIQAVCFGFIIRLLIIFNPQALTGHLLLFLQLGFFINAGIAFFNLLPIPPLDGSKILMGVLPSKHIQGYMNATRHALLVLIGLLVFGYMTGNHILSMILNPFYKPFLNLIQFITFGKAVWAT
ncbi:MAG: site-2 protease family protein [Chitinispirillales bacterium]|jgi:Zn-dependent protease|nr:site-2 protease family protein [Chitinispirillales bacterium]